MDKDNRDDFTFAKLSDLKLPLTFRMYVVSDLYPNGLCPTDVPFSSQLEGTRPRKSISDVLENPELRFHGAQSSYDTPPLHLFSPYCRTDEGTGRFQISMLPVS